MSLSLGAEDDGAQWSLCSIAQVMARPERHACAESSQFWTMWFGDS